MGATLKNALEQNISLAADNEAFREALLYWLPTAEPLAHQVDAVSTKHRQQWHSARALLAKAGAI